MQNTDVRDKTCRVVSTCRFHPSAVSTKLYGFSGAQVLQSNLLLLEVFSWGRAMSRTFLTYRKVIAGLPFVSLAYGAYGTDDKQIRPVSGRA